MMQMVSDKWRNAYLLVYERKADNVPEQENGEVIEQKLEENSSAMSLDANKDKEENPMVKIEEQIQESNSKYWKNRFLFG
jgi:hypothetical protein